ncbi:hypothetical protein HGI30_02140 [Paenibacillus albicereus]|uniref:DUF4871 domain-containing protein n=1 Tax=Paenibacillus albicereus TaxID=2726185 RepID=A0A6H2GSY1_9BACL|nr:hypothetical protein [Paenibacillus albicereus]QJC50507.1 hypothetical protein HGI30_02140 [Paenibacillus albicereus]
MDDRRLREALQELPLAGPEFRPELKALVRRRAAAEGGQVGGRRPDPERTDLEGVRPARGGPADAAGEHHPGRTVPDAARSGSADQGGARPDRGCPADRAGSSALEPVPRRASRPLRGRSRLRWLVGSAVALVLLAALLPPDLWRGQSPAASVAVERLAYERDGKVVLQAFPEGNGLKAGLRQGLLLVFDEPTSAHRGEEVTVTAVHEATGARETIADALVGEAGPDSQPLERFGASFVLPYGGMWRVEATLDGTFYGDVVLAAAEPEPAESPLFLSRTYSSETQSYSTQPMRGEEGRVGILDVAFTAGRSQKVMWHFWERNFGELDGEFVVRAVRPGSAEPLDVYPQVGPPPRLGGPLSGADRHLPTGIALPEPGLWRLLPYVDGRLIGSIVVRAQEASAAE